MLPKSLFLLHKKHEFFFFIVCMCNLSLFFGKAQKNKLFRNSPKKMSSYFDTLRTVRPDALFMIERNKNQNIVVYEAVRSSVNHACLDSKEPVRVYWEEIDPAYMAANRKKGKTDNYSPLNAFERQFAYGVASHRAAVTGAGAGSSSSNNNYDITLVSLPSKILNVRFNPKGFARAYTTVAGQPEVELTRVFVHIRERMLATPVVEFIDLYGISPTTGSPVSERLHHK
jgi:hypothetical protein